MKFNHFARIVAHFGSYISFSVCIVCCKPDLHLFCSRFRWQCDGLGIYRWIQCPVHSKKIQVLNWLSVVLKMVWKVITWYQRDILHYSFVKIKCSSYKLFILKICMTAWNRFCTQYKPMDMAFFLNKICAIFSESS